MAQTPSDIGIRRPRPRCFLSPIDILRTPLTVAQYVDPDAQAVHDTKTKYLPLSGSRMSTLNSDHLETQQDHPVVLRIEELDRYALLWILQGAEFPLVVLGMGWREKWSALITKEDAKSSQPWSFLSRSHDVLGSLITEREIGGKHKGDSVLEQGPTPLRMESTDDVFEGFPDTEGPGCQASGSSPTTSSNRVPSFQSTSDASTRRSSIWDDGYDNDTESQASPSDTTELSGVGNGDDERDKEVECLLEDNTSLPSSPTLTLATLHQAGVTLVRSPKRRRSSHPMVLLLHAENAHLKTQTEDLQTENDLLKAQAEELQAENVHLQIRCSNLEAQNVDLLTALEESETEKAYLSSTLADTSASLVRAHDTIDTQSLQIRSLRRRIRFLEQWVDNLHDEKVLLHEEKIVRAEALGQLQASYETLEKVVERMVAGSGGSAGDEALEQGRGKMHDCELEVKLNAVMGRLEGLRIVS